MSLLFPYPALVAWVNCAVNSTTPLTTQLESKPRPVPPMVPRAEGQPNSKDEIKDPCLRTENKAQVFFVLEYPYVLNNYN